MRSKPRHITAARRAGRWLAGLALVAVLPAQALAQLRLPSLNLPALPTVPSTPPLGEPLADRLQRPAPLQALRERAVRDLLLRHPDLVEADPLGDPIRRGELLWLSPAAASVEQALADGFVLLRQDDWPELGLRKLVLRPPRELGSAAGAERLRRLDANAVVEFNHLYLPGGEVSAAPATAAKAPPGAAPLRVGLVDGGVDRRHPAFAQASLRAFGCGGEAHPSAHGTAVASLLVGRERGFAGAVPQATLFAADVYCERPVGGSAEEVAAALAWMAREQVPVVNVSLVGPPNRLLELAVQALLRRGHLLVAAVGNDGPAAPPLYPAAYPGVVGVTGVTPARRALPEAAQGPQVMLAAPGAELAVARAGGGWRAARGTSFAAPVVAGLLARWLAQPDPQAASAALARLAAGAIDLGTPGRDPVYGFGLVGEAAPTRASAMRAGD
ncbi:S8 family serine peptidase [Caldimonas sp. KR1-144]|uniref:S8 family serine peptidase n=1 Tax=Caldimonas sp. KR1-144 TaxID=3400911 RepID=UPI003BFD7AE4